MKFVYSDSHKLHYPQTEYHRGEMVTPFEKPERIDLIIRHLDEVGFTDPIERLYPEHPIQCRTPFQYPETFQQALRHPETFSGRG